MAGLARNAVGVIRRTDLRKSLRLGGACRMTLRAQHRCIRLHWSYRRWILCMPRQRSMAGFAVHMRVLAFVLHIEHVAVASLASLVAGKLHRSSGNLADDGAAIVPVLSEALGNHVMANNKKD